MEDNYETITESVPGEELRAYLERHSGEEITAGCDEFLTHVKNLCRLITALYKEYKFQLLALGVYVTVDMHIAVLDKTRRVASIGFNPEMEKILKEGKDGGE